MKTLKESYKFMADFLKEKKDNPQKTIQEIVETINQKNKPVEDNGDEIEETENPS